MYMISMHGFSRSRRNYLGTSDLTVKIWHYSSQSGWKLVGTPPVYLIYFGTKIAGSGLKNIKKRGITEMGDHEHKYTEKQ